MVTRTRINKMLYAHSLSCHIQRTEWVFVLCLYVLYELYCLKTYRHSNAFIPRTKTGIAQSLQFLGYAVCKGGRMV